MAVNEIGAFLERLKDSSNQAVFVKLTLSKKRNKGNDLNNVFVKPVSLKTGEKHSFVYRHATKDITHNFGLTESISEIEKLLSEEFYHADLFTTAADFHLMISKKGNSTLIQKQPVNASVPETTHDKIKKRYVNTENNIYLRKLGVTSADEKVKSDMQDKYRQINKYVEILESIVKEAALPDTFNIADMGAGKGYLTFALYDYLVNSMNLHPNITGVEMRAELVNNCNTIAEEAGFKKLHFEEGSIDTAELPEADMLIALHACDIATDQAIYRGIKADAKVIVCAPCCHKQIRKQMHPLNDLKAISAFGILEERQAEILTDTIRALILRAFGYKTKVFEFISTEHTPKNVLIVGIKTSMPDNVKKEGLEQIKGLKTMFNIEYHHLEKLMGI